MIPKSQIERKQWIVGLAAVIGGVLLALASIAVGIGTRSISNFVGAMYLFGFVGLCAAIIGGIALYNANQNAAKRRKLQQNGVVVQAKLISAAEDGAEVVNGQYAYVVTCSATLPNGQETQFCSRPLGFDPAPHLQQQEVQVVYQPDDVNNYFVDVLCVYKKQYTAGQTAATANEETAAPEAEETVAENREEIPVEETTPPQEVPLPDEEAAIKEEPVEEPVEQEPPVEDKEAAEEASPVPEEAASTDS